MPIRVPFSLIIAYVLAGVVIGMVIYHILAKLKISKANVTAEKIVEDANSKANNIIKEATLDAKTQAYEYKLEAEKEIKAQRTEVTRFENKLLQREQNIDRRDIALQSKEDNLQKRSQQLDRKQAELGRMENDLKSQIDAKVKELEKIAAMSAAEARAELFKQVEGLCLSQDAVVDVVPVVGVHVLVEAAECIMVVVSRPDREMDDAEKLESLP